MTDHQHPTGSDDAPPPLGLTPDEFRRAGRELVDWIADYYERIGDLPVTPDLAPGDLRALLPDEPPERPEPFDAILADLDRVVLPGLTHWQSPHWFAYFPTGASFPSILAELLSAGLGQQGMVWATSPITTELEVHVLDWLVELMGLPSAWRSEGPGGGVIQMSASDSTHTALVVARHQSGADPSRAVAYASTQAHSSIEKGANVAGYGHVRSIEVDDAFAMRPDRLAAAIASDREAGLRPAFVCGAVGTTGTTAVDPIRPIGEITRREGLWLHVDAAYAGAAMLCPEFRHHQDGLEHADSYVWNPHKWLAVNFDCSVFHVAERRTLLDALSILPPYLRGAASTSDAAVDYRDWHVPLGRRTRALKLWFVLRSYGAEGLRRMIREHVRLARELESTLAEDARFELVAPTPFALVSFRCRAGDTATTELAAALNVDGKVHLTTSSLPDDTGRERPFIRVSIGASLTGAEHVERLWRLIDELAD